MDKQSLKAIIMAILSPNGIGGELNKTSFTNLDNNSQKIIDHCMKEKDNG